MSSIYEICKVTQIVSFLISNISCTKQSNFLLHFLRTENCLSRSFGDSRVFILIMFASGGRHIFVFNHALVYVPSCVTYITCIAQVTFVGSTVEAKLTHTSCTWFPLLIGQVCSQVWCRPHLAANFGFCEIRTSP